MALGGFQANFWVLDITIHAVLCAHLLADVDIEDETSLAGQTQGFVRGVTGPAWLVTSLAGSITVVVGVGPALGTVALAVAGNTVLSTPFADASSQIKSRGARGAVLRGCRVTLITSFFAAENLSVELNETLFIFQAFVSALTDLAPILASLALSFFVQEEALHTGRAQFPTLAVNAPRLAGFTSPCIIHEVSLLTDEALRIIAVLAVAGAGLASAIHNAGSTCALETDSSVVGQALPAEILLAPETLSGVGFN